MSPRLLTVWIAAAVCLVSLFVAIERYQANADSVAAMNRLGGGMLRAMSGGETLEPGTPAATKYALLLATLSGAVAVGAFVMHAKDAARGRPEG